MKGKNQSGFSRCMFWGISESVRSVVSVDNLSRTGWAEGVGVVLKKTTETETEREIDRINGYICLRARAVM